MGKTCITAASAECQVLMKNTKYSLVPYRIKSLVSNKCSFFGGTEKNKPEWGVRQECTILK